MKKSIIALTGIIFALIIFFGCGSNVKQDVSSSAAFLPEKTSRTNMERVGEIRTFVGDSLWEYIDGGAEVYHLYNFIDVTTADYKSDQVDLVADIYHFDGSLNAFGLYSMLCTPETEKIKLGVAGFIAPATINFVKGEYLVRLTGFDDSQETELALMNLAEELNEKIPGTTEKPEQFKLFPEENAVGGTDKYYAKEFLGQKFLDQVFSRDIILEPDTVTLFLSDDLSGGKFLNWSTFADQIDKKKKSPPEIPYDDTLSFVLEDNYYGDIIIGLKNGKLLGMVNFKNDDKDYLSEWMSKLGGN